MKTLRFLRVWHLAAMACSLGCGSATPAAAPAEPPAAEADVDALDGAPESSEASAGFAESIRPVAEIAGETYVILGPGEHVAEIPSEASELVSTEHVEWYRRPLDGTGPDFTFVPRSPSRRLGPTSVSGRPIVELIRFCPSQLRGTELGERRLAELYGGVYPTSGLSWRAMPVERPSEGFAVRAGVRVEPLERERSGDEAVDARAVAISDHRDAEPSTPFEVFRCGRRYALVTYDFSSTEGIMQHVLIDLENDSRLRSFDGFLGEEPVDLYALHRDGEEAVMWTQRFYHPDQIEGQGDAYFDVALSESGELLFPLGLHYEEETFVSWPHMNPAHCIARGPR